jgi:hypothetical protein
MTKAAIALGAITLLSSAMLLLHDAAPGIFPARTHDFLAAFSLGFIALAWLLWQQARRSNAKELLKAVLLAAAFLFWAANQFWPNIKAATLFNDLAVFLFVLDVLLAMAGWPATDSGKDA